MHFIKHFFKYTGQVLVFTLACLPGMIVIRYVLALILAVLQKLIEHTFPDLALNNVHLPLFWTLQGIIYAAALFAVPKRFQWQFTAALLAAFLLSLGLGQVHY